MLLRSEPPVNIVPNKDRLSPVREVALPYFQDPILSIFPIKHELFFYVISPFQLFRSVCYGQATSSLPCTLPDLNI